MDTRRGSIGPISTSRAGAALALLVAMLVLSACVGVITPSGTVKTETREVGDFDRVALTGVGTLTIAPGKEASLVVRADEKLLPYIKTEVEGNELVIELETRGRILRLGSDPAIEYELTAPSITAITNSGSGMVTGGPFSGGLFAITDSGSGKIVLDEVKVISLSSTVSGSGEVEIKAGVVGAQEVNVSGSGSFNAPDLESRVATVRVSGSGSVELWATEGLDAQVSGSGSVSYWGSPRLTEESSGSGEVKALGDKSSSTE